MNILQICINKEFNQCIAMMLIDIINKQLIILAV